MLGMRDPFTLQAAPVFQLSDDGGFETELQDLLEGDDQRFDGDALPEELPILSVRNTVLFPGVVTPVTVARDRSIELVKAANRTEGKRIGVIAQRDPEVEDPTGDDLYEVGTTAAILRLIRMPDGSITIIIQGRQRFRTTHYTQSEPYLKAAVAKVADRKPKEEEAKAMMLSLKKEATRIIELSPKIPTEANITLQNIGSLGFLVNFIAANLNTGVEQKQAILETPRLMARARKVLEHMASELQVLEISEEIQNRVKTDLDKQQRDYILRQQIKAIQDELGEEVASDEIEELEAQAAKKAWPQAAQAAFEKEKNKLLRLNPASPEYGVSFSYLEWMLELPWGHCSEDRLDLAHAEEVLEAHHYGLAKVKQRILEHLAVLKLKGGQSQGKAPILCLYGPPGVGKTSLGRSIATALNRQFVRMSLGGVRDEAEIRGHRRTYIGSMPGRILQGLKKAGTGNPVFVLDEIDKVGADFRGDPASALLEVLDPEQNTTFNDHYLELDYDLSPVLFIATANTLDTIHPALRDRLEIIEVTGYTRQEKIQIARRHLLPKVREAHGLKAAQLKLSEQLLGVVVDDYTRESGVRLLDQQLAKVARGVARDVVLADEKDETLPNRFTEKRLRGYLGAPRFDNEVYEKSPYPGVAIGLAWTAVGGEILFIETTLVPGKGRLTLTGQLGEVMKESGNLAYSYLRAHARQYGIPKEVFTAWDVHVHIPAGAIPKDGPSAGITLLTALASLFSRRRVRPHLAMSGELTLRGKVLPVGGIKEKVLAAARAGITDVILCKQNARDVAEIEPEHIAQITFHYVDDLGEVLKLALESKPIEDPTVLLPPEALQSSAGITPMA